MALSGGKYAAEVAKGRVFILSTAAAGVTIPASNTTSPTLCCWNTTADKLLVPLRWTAGFVSGTIAVGTVGWAYKSVGTSVATALSAFNDSTAATLNNAYLGAGNANSARYSPAGTNTLAAASTSFAWTKQSIESATAGTGIQGMGEDFDGSLILYPGQIMYPVATSAQTASFVFSVWVAEVPINA